MLYTVAFVSMLDLLSGPKPSCIRHQVIEEKLVRIVACSKKELGVYDDTGAKKKRIAVIFSIVSIFSCLSM